MHSHAPTSGLWLTEFNTPHDACCHRIIEVLHQHKTRFQEMMIVRSGTCGKALVLDGCWQSCSGDEFIYHEALVHPPCLLQGGPEKILILGGGEGAALREALKWRSVQQAVMVDLDKEVVDACRRYLPEMHQGAFEDPRTRVVIADAFDYVETAIGQFDVIISDLTDPLENGPSAKLFTREYFEKCQRALAPGGCFVLQAGLAGPIEMGIHVRLARTVAAVFERMFHWTAHVPSWGSPMGFVCGADHSVGWTDPDPRTLDHQLTRVINGPLRFFDGRAMRALMHPPKYLRDAIAAETHIYSLDALPRSI
ncbi:MAG: methyltransferase domain-containing protein [Desulfatitalea sp.]|nr:methyltransferase domain-containing protein [Desulfatitalea sp.]